MHTAYLALGSNLGNKHLNIMHAAGLIATRIGKIKKLSELHETEPWGFSSENMFVNAAVCIETDMSPRELLTATKDIEKKLGRNSKSSDGEYNDRIIDIDILIYDDITVDEPDLKIPHPLMTKRDFVMIPLSEIK